MTPHRHERTGTKTGLVPGTPIYTGHQTVSVQVSCMEYNDTAFHERPITNLDALDTAQSPSTISWINVDGLSDTALLARLGARFQLHPLLLEDIANVTQRPKLDEHEQQVFITLKMLQWHEATHEIEHEHVSLVLGPTYVLSFQERPGDVFGWVRDRLRNAKGRIRTQQSDYLFYALLDAIVDGYFLVLDKIGDAIEALEDETITAPSSQIIHRLNALKHELIALRKAVLPLREAVSSLLKAEHPLVARTTVPFLRDLYDHILHTTDLIDSYRELLNSLFDVYLSLVSQRTNEIMKVLTIFTAIFIPLTFLVGVYGMNFDVLPELHWRYSYAALWGGMLALGGGLLWWFKRKRWI